ncbi:aldose 1-epimerase family protein [uncultured Devosia sp.]|uniref:aldose 1-epimerase family protein n=1 Tax=uncultured Devosia sp. TaxID=211434 RepID=UPI0035CB9B62
MNTRIGNEQLSVEVSPLGAEMQAITTADGAQWLWHGDGTYWGGRSPILFPMVGKAPNDTISLDGKSYPMSQHGFARRSDFELVAASATSCRFELMATEASREVYPFDFLLAVTHAVEGTAVTVTAEVTNRDQKVMPFGIGFHPAFVWPLSGATTDIHEVRLDNGAEPALIRLEQGLVVPRELASPFRAGKLVLEHDLFEADAMLFPQGAGAGLTYGCPGGPSIKLDWENLPNLALWSKPGAPFICIEPWHGTAAEVGGSDDLAQRPYAEVLGPGATARFVVRAAVRG